MVSFQLGEQLLYDCWERRPLSHIGTILEKKIGLVLECLYKVPHVGNTQKFRNIKLNKLPKDYSLSLKIGLLTQKEQFYSKKGTDIPTIHVQVRTVSFREGS